MRALSIIGIILSVGGLLTSLVVMTEAKCHCYCNDDYLYSSGSVPDEAIGGSFIMLIISIFFLVFSIVAAAKSFGKNSPISSQPIPPFQANPFPNYNQPYNQQHPTQNQQYQQNPYQQQNPYINPYQQNQNPPVNPNPPQPPPPPTNPWAPPQQ